MGASGWEKYSANVMLKHEHLRDRFGHAFVNTRVFVGKKEMRGGIRTWGTHWQSSSRTCVGSECVKGFNVKWLLEKNGEQAYAEENPAGGKVLMIAGAAALAGLAFYAIAKAFGKDEAQTTTQRQEDTPIFQQNPEIIQVSHEQPR